MPNCSVYWTLFLYNFCETWLDTKHLLSSDVTE
jgi:hypothetical protein